MLDWSKGTNSLRIFLNWECIVLIRIISLFAFSLIAFFSRIWNFASAKCNSSQCHLTLPHTKNLDLDFTTTNQYAADADAISLTRVSDFPQFMSRRFAPPTRSAENRADILCEQGSRHLSRWWSDDGHIWNHDPCLNYWVRKTYYRFLEWIGW